MLRATVAATVAATVTSTVAAEKKKRSSFRRNKNYSDYKSSLWWTGYLRKIQVFLITRTRVTRNKGGFDKIST